MLHGPNHWIDTRLDGIKKSLGAEKRSLRLELGPRDMQEGVCVLVRRDTSQKTFDVPWTDVPMTVTTMPETMQSGMFQRQRPKWMRVLMWHERGRNSWMH